MLKNSIMAHEIQFWNHIPIPTSRLMQVEQRTGINHSLLNLKPSVISQKKICSNKYVFNQTVTVKQTHKTRKEKETL